MLGNSHVQFLGRSGPATGRSYPTAYPGARRPQSVDRCGDQGCCGKKAGLPACQGSEGRLEHVRVCGPLSRPLTERSTAPL